MNCSVKFLAPIVIAGLPLPGCDASVVVPPDLSSLPQAASANASTDAVAVPSHLNLIVFLLLGLVRALPPARRAHRVRGVVCHAARAVSPRAAVRRMRAPRGAPARRRTSIPRRRPAGGSSPG